MVNEYNSSKCFLKIIIQKIVLKCYNIKKKSIMKKQYKKNKKI